jgi:hypothetical protein
MRVLLLAIFGSVIYLDGNDPGPGFYGLAQDMHKLSRHANDLEKLEFWSGQVAALHARYRRKRP